MWQLVNEKTENIQFCQMSTICIFLKHLMSIMSTVVWNNEARVNILDLKESRSLCCHDLSTRLIKRNIYIIVFPLIKLINKCFRQSYSQYVLKITKVLLPFFKKGESLIVYRPVFKFTCQVFEKAMHPRITEFFEQYYLFKGFWRCWPFYFNE